MFEKTSNTKKIKTTIYLFQEFKMETSTIESLYQKADLIRKMCIECIANFGVGHIGGSSSIIELLTALYFKCANIDPQNPNDPNRDRIVLSKGHAAPGLYSALAARGYFDKRLLLTLNQNGTSLPSHADMLKVPGVDFTAGSLGQGISAAVGMALNGKISGKKYRTYAIVGDGESQEGQVWEALMLAGAKRLTRFTVIIDNNKMQIDGTTDEVCKVEPFESKLRAFGFKVYTVDGHNIEEIIETIEKCNRSRMTTAIVLNTIKGKGIKCCEGHYKSHSVSFTPEMLANECTGEVLK